MSVRKGEIACLLGASGCGKPRCYAQLPDLNACKTERSMCHSAVLPVPAFICHRKNVMSAWSSRICVIPHLTAQQNVAFGLRRMPREEQQARVTELLKMVELHSHANRYPHELSGGQQQRIALARVGATSGNPVAR